MTAQRFAVALLLVTLLGPVAGGLAGIQMGMGMDMVPGARDALPHHSGEHDAGIMDGHSGMGSGPADDSMGGSHCDEPGSETPHRCAGLWSTACCDYFAPGTKVEIDPALDSSSSHLDALAATSATEDLVATAIRGHLILPTTGESRAGPTSLPILHSALLF